MATPADKPLGTPMSPALSTRPAVAPEVRRLASEGLFAGSQEVQIEHHGVLYRLKQTALGKLILTK